MIRRDLRLRTGAFIVSLLIHGLLFFHFGTLAGNSDAPTPERDTTRVTFRAVTAPQTVPQPHQEQPSTVAVPEPEVIEASEPPPEPLVIPTQQPAERARQLAPTPAPPASPPAVQEETASKADKAPAALASQGAVADPALLEQARQEYVRRLKAHIDAHKEYPRAARRRGIEGEVRVEFVLLSGGQIDGLQVGGAHDLLVKAAREAMDKALPLPQPPEGVSLPWTLGFTMSFALR